MKSHGIVMLILRGNPAAHLIVLLFAVYIYGHQYQVVSFEARVVNDCDANTAV